jgi:hypothetical protein
MYAAQTVHLECLGADLQATTPLRIFDALNKSPCTYIGNHQIRLSSRLSPRVRNPSFVPMTRARLFLSCAIVESTAGFDRTNYQ